MPLIRHSERPEAEPYPGVKRQSIVGRDTGAGSLHTSWVTIAPGARVYVHRHKVEEAMLIVAGKGLAILGEETLRVKANETLLAPAGVRHGFVNTGSEPLIVSGIFPTVDVEIIVEDEQG